MIPDGFYALHRPSGHLAFFRVADGGTYLLRGYPGRWWRVWLAPAPAAAVRRGISQDRLVTPDGEHLSGPAAAAVRYAQESTTCARCYSPLSNPTSLRTGLGPECRRLRTTEGVPA